MVILFIYLQGISYSVLKAAYCFCFAVFDLPIDSLYNVVVYTAFN